MLTGVCSINLYLFSAVLVLAIGCDTTEPAKHSKEASTLRLHLEANQDGSQHNSAVPIYREKPILVYVNREPFLTEVDLESADVVDVVGGFAIQVRFNHHGALLLDNTTTAFKGRKIAIFSQFPESRWLAAPVINRRITDGVLVFTPDATQEEAGRIVRGLNNFAAVVKKRSKF